MTDVWRVERPAKYADAQRLVRDDWRRACSARADNLAVRRIRLAHRIAQVARVVLVIDRAVRVVKLQISIASMRSIWMKPDHVLEINDRRIVCLSFQVMHSGQVILFREQLVECRQLLCGLWQER